jgi:hypothetical protein
MRNKEEPPRPMSTEITEDHLKEDFGLFVFYLWKHLGLPAPTPRQMEIADYLQHGPPRKMIQAFRGIGKSWISAAYCVWILWKDPQRKILVVSATGQRAKDFTLFCQRLIEEVPVLQSMRPRADQKNHRWSVLNFDVSQAEISQSPSMKAAGITGQITGSRATDIIFDDVEVPDNSLTVDAREKLLNKCTVEGESVLVPDLPTTVTYLGTPQTEESLYKAISERGYKLRVWPARVPSSIDKAETYGGCLAQSIEDMLYAGLFGEPTDPQRFDDTELEERRMSMGNSGFQLQFMLDTSLSDAERYPLRLSDLVVLEAGLQDKGPTSVVWASGRPQVIQGLPQVGLSGDRWHRPMTFGEPESWAKWDGVVMSVDPSGRGSDETTYTVVAMLGGTLFVLAQGGLQGGYTEEVLKGICKEALRCKVNNIVVEANFGDGMFVQLLTPVLERIHPGCGIEEVRHNKQKELRIIDTLEPVLNQHRLVIPVGVIQKDLKETQGGREVYSLFRQLTRLTKDRGCLKHDDRLDALAMAAAYWTTSMSRDTERAQKEYEEEAIRVALEEHAENYRKSQGGGYKDPLGSTAGIFGTPVGPQRGYKKRTFGNILSNL